MRTIKKLLDKPIVFGNFTDYCHCIPDTGILMVSATFALDFEGQYVVIKHRYQKSSSKKILMEDFIEINKSDFNVDIPTHQFDRKSVVLKVG